jgi:hypothetical protein
VHELLALVPEGSRDPLLVIAERVTFSSAERSLLLIDVLDEPGRTFRVIPDAFQSVIGNLAIDNVTFGDYLNTLDASGVHRLEDRHYQALAELQSHRQPNKPDSPSKS